MQYETETKTSRRKTTNFKTESFLMKIYENFLHRVLQNFKKKIYYNKMRQIKRILM